MEPLLVIETLILGMAAYMFIKAGDILRINPFWTFFRALVRCVALVVVVVTFVDLVKHL